MVQRLQPRHDGPRDARPAGNHRTRLRPRAQGPGRRRPAPMTGRVAIVSGGTGALGQSVSLRLLSAGATVCVPYVVPAEVDALKARAGAAGARLQTTHADVTDAAVFGTFVRGVLDAHGR